MRSSFEIKRLSSTRDKEYAQAIKVYLETTPPDIKTDTNEIAYWLDAPDRRRDWEMFFFALIYNDEVIGFAELAYLRPVKVVMIDYIATEVRFKKNSVFYPFLNMLIHFFIDSQLDFHYVVAEVSVRDNGTAIDSESAFFKQMVASEDFELANALYRQPYLGPSNKESNFDCNLLVKPIAATKYITRLTYLRMVKSIYYDHYASWYQPVMTKEQFAKYKAHLDRIYDAIEKAVSKRDTIELINFKITDCEYYSMDKCRYGESTAGYAELITKKKPSYLYIPVVIALTFVISIAIYSIVQRLSIKPESLGPIFSATSSLVVGMCVFIMGRRFSDRK